LEVESTKLEVESTKWEDGNEKVEVGKTKLEDDVTAENNDAIASPLSTIQPITHNPQPTTVSKPQTTHNQQSTTTETKVSSLSLSSIKAKKELLEAQKGIVKEVVHLPSEAFTETEMQAFWFKYADRLGDKGYKIMESLLRINDPRLEGVTIIHELPNASSSIDFEKEKYDLLTYLRSHLHNHDIAIEVRINESIESKKAFTTVEKFNRLNEINSNLEVLKKTFDLDL
jgi:hypothetical protein